MANGFAELISIPCYSVIAHLVGWAKRSVPTIRASRCRQMVGTAQTRLYPVVRSRRRPSLLPGAHPHPGPHGGWYPRGRDRIAQAIFRKLLHAGDRLGEIGGLERHQHLLV